MPQVFYKCFALISLISGGGADALGGRGQRGSRGRARRAGPRRTTSRHAVPRRLLIAALSGHQRSHGTDARPAADCSCH